MGSVVPDWRSEPRALSGALLVGPGVGPDVGVGARAAVVAVGATVPGITLAVGLGASNGEAIAATAAEGVGAGVAAVPPGSLGPNQPKTRPATTSVSTAAKTLPIAMNGT